MYPLREYRGGSPTAVPAWRPCPLWEPSPSHPILSWARGFAVFCVHVCLLYVWFVCVLCVPSLLWYCWSGVLTCKNRLPYNRYCVGGDVKHYSIQSIDGYHICYSHVHIRWLKWRTESVNPSKHIYIAPRVTGTAEALDSMDRFKCWLYALPNRVMPLLVHVWNMNMVIVCDNVGWRTRWRWCICSDDKFEETLCILVVSRIILVHMCMLYEWGVGLYQHWMFHDSMSYWVSTDRELDWMSHGSLSYWVIRSPLPHCKNHEQGC